MRRRLRWTWSRDRRKRGRRRGTRLLNDRFGRARRRHPRPRGGSWSARVGCSGLRCRPWHCWRDRQSRRGQCGFKRHGRELLQSLQPGRGVCDSRVQRRKLAPNDGKTLGNAVLEGEPDADLIGIDHCSRLRITWASSRPTSRAASSAPAAPVGAKKGRGGTALVPCS